MAAELDQLCTNIVRFLSVDAVQKANSGHPGMPLGAALNGLIAVDAPAQAQSAQSGLVRSRQVRTLGRARFDVALQPAAPNWLRPLAGRHQALPAVGEQNARTPRARAYAWRGGRGTLASQFDALDEPSDALVVDVSAAPNAIVEHILSQVGTPRHAGVARTPE